MSGKGAIGKRVGGKGSWRRKTKKTQSASQEADKLWLAAQRQGCRDIGEIDTATMIVAGSDEAYSFKNPELALDMRANTYCLRGAPEKKPLVDVLQDMLSGLDLKKPEEKKEELGDVENVDFSKTEEKKE